MLLWEVLKFFLPTHAYVFQWKSLNKLGTASLHDYLSSGWLPFTVSYTKWSWFNMHNPQEPPRPKKILLSFYWMEWNSVYITNNHCLLNHADFVPAKPWCFIRLHVINAAYVKAAPLIIFRLQRFRRCMCCVVLAHLWMCVMHFPCEMVHTVYNIDPVITWSCNSPSWLVLQSDNALACLSESLFNGIWCT